MGKKTGEPRQYAKPLELIEEAVHLLRRSPPRVFVAYYLGTIPFTLGFLYFWADMSRGFNAWARLVPATLGLTVGYIFMKTMQTVYARRLRNEITGEEEPEMKLSLLARTAAMHSIYQPWGFLLLPAALLVTVPFGWCFAFFQNLTVLGPGRGDLSSARRKAWEQSLLWPAQNHLALGILLLFSLIVMANLLITAMYAPHLIRTLFGIESVFSRSGPHLANTTFLMIVAAATYLCVDPVVKAFYVLRCFYGQSLQSGADLKVELKAARTRRMPGILGVVVLASFFLAGSPLAGASVSPPAASATVKAVATPPQEIEKAVETVLSRLEYSWRLPRESPQEDTGPGGGIRDILRTWTVWIQRAAEAVDGFFQRLGDLIRKLFPGGRDSSGETSGGSAGSSILYILLFAGAAVSALIVQKLFRKQPDDADVSMAAPEVKGTDLTDENTLASDLPENEWMNLARDLLDKGEERLGIRAMYLAALAHLAARGIISLARHKTDREYEKELASRGEFLSGITSAFRDLRGIFERAWYGMHDTSRQTMEIFLQRHQEVMRDGTHPPV